MPFIVDMKRLKHAGIYIGTSFRKAPIPAIPTTPADKEFFCGMPALYPVVERASALSWGWFVSRGIEKSAPYAESGHFVGPDGVATEPNPERCRLGIGECPDGIQTGVRTNPLLK